MKDLRTDLSNVWRAAARIAAPQGSRAIMFISARSGDGTTSMAASFALLAAKRAKRNAWLVDLDLRVNAAFKGFQTGFSHGVGRPGRAYDASLGTEQIYTVFPKTVSSSGRRSAPQKLLSVHQIENEKLLVTRFREDRLRPAQRVHVSTQPAWWTKLRRVADWVVVDAPAIERSGAGLAVVNQMDGVVLVVRADDTSAEDLTALRREVEIHRGNIIGVAINAVRSDARLADRMAI